MCSVMLTLFLSGFGAALQLWDGLSPPHSSMVTANPAVKVPPRAPCFFDDTVAMLHEAGGDDGELTNSSLTLFGVCRSSGDNSSVLSELSEELKRNKREGLEVLNPAAVLVSEENDQEGIMLTFDLPQHPLLNLKLVLMLVFESPLTGGDLVVTFSGQFLQPNMQSACLSEGTQYILLKGQSSEGNVEQKWRISAQTKHSDMKQNLKNIFIGGKSGSSLYMTPLLLFSAEQGTRRSNGSVWSPQTSFLCELRRFLDAVLPQGHLEAPLCPLDSLQSLPPLLLGLSSSETLLAGIINSSAPTFFSFNSWSSSSPVRREQLALSLSLLEELRQRLEKNEMEMMELIRQDKITHRAAEKLERLKDLSAFQRKDPATDGESQYCAFLLLKALQTVVQAYDLQKRLRAIRADSTSPERGNSCGLRSLTVGLQKLFLGPSTTNINNCQGLCVFPLLNGNNHAALLNYHTEGGGVDERAPCCVPVAYDPLQVLDFNEEGTFLSIKPDMIAKECGCR